MLEFKITITKENLAEQLEISERQAELILEKLSDRDYLPMKSLLKSFLFHRIMEWYR